MKKFRLPLLVALFPPLYAASVFAAPALTVGSVTGQAGTTVNLPITFDPTTAQVAGIQFSLILPAGLSTGTITPGAILTNAGKSISSSFSGNTWNILIIGFNSNTIPAGSLLTAQVAISPGTSTGNLSVSISTVIYSDTGGFPIAPGSLTDGTVTVAPPTPAITSAGTATGQVGVLFNYQITATNNPTAFNATGLPAGLSINTGTGVISGTPTTAATSNVTISGANAGGTGTKILTLTITPATPVITSTGSMSGQVGVPFSYQISATNNPTSFNATGLPTGLSVNTVTGSISGTPTAAGMSSVSLSATNAGGTGTKTLSLTINPAKPVITSATSTTGTVGVLFNYQIVATNSPTSYSATGLPTGLTINTVTGIISGTPTTSGISNVALSATNAGGTGTTTLAVTIHNPPCDVNNDATTNILDVQLAVNQALGITSCTADIDLNGSCNILDVQRIINAALGGQCVVGP